MPLDQPLDQAPGLYQFRALDRSGDGLKTSWTPGNADQERGARATFDNYRNLGYDIFRLTEDDNRGGRLTEFDPNAGSMLAVPRMRGGWVDGIRLVRQRYLDLADAGIRQFELDDDCCNVLDGTGDAVHIANRDVSNIARSTALAASNARHHSAPVPAPWRQ